MHTNICMSDKVSGPNVITGQSASEVAFAGLNTQAVLAVSSPGHIKYLQEVRNWPYI